MSDIDINRVLQNIKELQAQNAIDFQQWKRLGQEIKRLEGKIKTSDNHLNLLMKKIKADYESLRKVIIDENVQVQLNNKIEKNKSEINKKVNKETFDNSMKSINEQMSNNVQQLNNKINEVATTGTTTEVIKNTTETYIQGKITDGTIANLTIENNSITHEKYKDNSVMKSKINSEYEEITNSFSTTPNSMIDFTGQTIEHGEGDYLNFKTIKYYEFKTNKIKIKLNMTDYSCFKYMFYDESKNFISGSGKYYFELSSLNATTYPVAIVDNYLIIDFKKAKEVYPAAKYVSFTFKKDETLEIYDITKKELKWLDLTNNETIKDIYSNLNVNVFEKPFVIFSFDWYSNMYDKRYQILKKEYGYNATFCLDGQTNEYNLDSTLTRQQFNEMINNGWDCALYGGVGERGSTEESWTNHIKGIIDQKESIGIFNPVMYNAPDNNNSDIVSNAVKNNEIKLHRCTTTDNLLKSPTQFKTGANFLTSTTLTSLKSQIDKAIENNYGLVVYTHLVISDGDTRNDGQDATQGHCYEWAFREILDYIKERVDTGELEVLTASEYYNKYNNIDSVEYDKNRETKRFNYLCNKLNLS